MKFDLIVPASKDYKDNKFPDIFKICDNGLSYCINAITNMNLSQFDNIYIAILKKYDDKYNLSGLLNMQFKTLGLTNASVVILNNPTLSQAETVYNVIIDKHISNGIFIKDADGKFSVDEIPYNNGISVYKIEDMQTLSPSNKSYVSIDELNFLTNIIEKKVIGEYINAGGYAFKYAETFTEYYNKYCNYKDKLHISHLIYAMLLDGVIFKPFEVENFVDFEI